MILQHTNIYSESLKTKTQCCPKIFSQEYTLIIYLSFIIASFPHKWLLSCARFNKVNFCSTGRLYFRAYNQRQVSTNDNDLLRNAVGLHVPVPSVQSRSIHDHGSHDGYDDFYMPKVLHHWRSRLKTHGDNSESEHSLSSSARRFRERA